MTNNENNKDFAWKFNTLPKLAEAGDARAQYQLGLMYLFEMMFFRILTKQ